MRNRPASRLSMFGAFQQILVLLYGVNAIGSPAQPPTEFGRFGQAESFQNDDDEVSGSRGEQVQGNQFPREGAPLFRVRCVGFADSWGARLDQFRKIRCGRASGRH
jgi:hypothetical protein